ncbi:MAG: hypothetical protein F6J97_01875 [Leptolyngbya sp. SIO4C1]|nr:hypothetical protein [Leptolyngbya sp. SIO4C1]
MAFAFQLLLTNLGIALGLSLLGWAPESETASETSKTAAASEQSSAALPVTHLLGFGVGLSLVTVLFAAALLATEFSQIGQPRQGAIFGLTLWATYLLIVTWLSSTTISGIVNSVLGTAAAGVRRLLSAIRQTVQSPEPDSQTEAEALRAIAAELAQTTVVQQQLPKLLAEQREVLLAEILEQTNLTDDAAESVLDGLQPPKPSSSESLTASPATAASSLSPGLSASDSSGSLLPFELPNWRQLLHWALSRADLSDWDLETLWQLLQGTDDASLNIVQLDAEDYLQHAPTSLLQSELLQTEFAELLYDPDAAPEQVLRQLQAVGRSDFVQWLKQRRDLSAEKISQLADRLSKIHQTVLKAVREKAAAARQGQWQQQLTQLLSQLPQLSAADLESWLQDLAERFSPKQAEHLLSQIDSARLVPIFEQTELTQTQQAEIAASLENSRDRVLAQLQKQRAAAADQAAELQDKLTAYFRYTSLDKLSAEAVAEKLRSQLEASQLLAPESSQDLKAMAGALDLTALEQIVARRQGMTPSLQSQLTEALQTAWQSYQLQTDRTADYTADSLWQLESLYQILEDYFQSVDWSQITLEEIKPQVMDLLTKAQTSHFEVSRMLSRLNLPPATKTQLGRWLQQIRYEALKLPRRWAKRASHTAQQASDRLTTSLSHYLRHQPKAALNPVQISKDLAQMVKEAAQSLPSGRLPQLDTAFWQQALADRRDMTQAESQRLVDWLTSAWEKVAQQAAAWADEINAEASAAVRSLSHLLDENLPGPNLIDAVGESVSDALATTRQQIVDRLSEAQQQLQAQAIAAQQEIQAQTDAVRQQVAIAAWWLFLGLLSSGIAAGGAGWLAAVY